MAALGTGIVPVRRTLITSLLRTCVWSVAQRGGYFLVHVAGLVVRSRIPVVADDEMEKPMQSAAFYRLVVMPPIWHSMTPQKRGSAPLLPDSDELVPFDSLKRFKSPMVEAAWQPRRAP